MLTLEVEFLSGVCFAAQSQSSAEPDWPPQPDRVFSALVAAWGSRGERANEQAALEWLEQLPSPGIFASKHEPRAVGISYVPPNDTSGKLETLPERRRRQPRMFPAAIPHHPVIFLRWDASADDATLRSLDELARATVYVGHSASLVRCRFLSSEREDTPPAVAALRTVYPGRMANLRQEYRTGRRPGAGATVAAVNPPATAAPPSLSPQPRKSICRQTEPHSTSVIRAHTPCSPSLLPPKP